MDIPLNTIVNVNISVSPTFPARAGFGTLLLVTKEEGPLSLSERLRSYSSIDGVTADWGATSEVTLAANAFFSQSPQPTSFMVGVRYEVAKAGVITGGSVPATELSSIQAITDGSFIITLGADTETVSGLNFSTATDMADVASALQVALRAKTPSAFTGCTVAYTDGVFIITSGDTGAVSTVSFLTEAATGTYIGTILKLEQGLALKANGLDAEGIPDSLAALNDIDPSWYGLAFTKEIRDEVVVNSSTTAAVDEAAAFVEARTKVYFTTTNNELALSSASTLDVLGRLSALEYSRTFVMYSSKPTQYPACSVAGRAFSVDFTSGNPSITLKFKKLPGITYEEMTVTQKNALSGKNGNAFISVAGNTMLAEGVVTSGRFFDEVHGLDWLENAIQTNVFGALYTDNKIPYTDAGVQILAQQVRSALEEGVEAGLLAPGTDSNGNFLPNGYMVYAVAVADVNQSDKESRIYNGLSFTALGAGAIHNVTINGVFER